MRRREREEKEREMTIRTRWEGNGGNFGYVVAGLSGQDWKGLGSAFIAFLIIYILANLVRIAKGEGQVDGQKRAAAHRTPPTEASEVFCQFGLLASLPRILILV